MPAHVSMNAVARTMVHGTELCLQVLLRRVLRAEQIDGVIRSRTDDRHQHDCGADAGGSVDQVDVALAVDGLRRTVAAGEAVNCRDDDVHAGKRGRQAGRIADIASDDLYQRTGELRGSRRRAA